MSCNKVLLKRQEVKDMKLGVGFQGLKVVMEIRKNILLSEKTACVVQPYGADLGHI